MANRKIKAELDIDGKDNTSPAFRSVATRIGQVEKQIAGFNRVAKDLGKSTTEINRRLRDIDKTSQSFSNRSAAMAGTAKETFSTIARYAAPAVIAAGAKRALTDFAAVEREMNRIGITAEASGDETAAAFTKVQTLSKQMAMPIENAISALDTLVSSGMNMKEAMDFLPSVLATAQASGATTSDIANTALKASSALQIQAGDMQHAFDIMVAGGKAGQFELKDMAMYIPDLANSFASLGYKGEDGLKRLVAILQTVREDTGSAQNAATYVENIFGKMTSQETVGNFKKMGVDLNAEMEKAKKNGEDVISAFVRISQMATKGDLSKLPLLFNDQQMRLGMQSLMTSTDSFDRFMKAVNDAKVDGTVWRDLGRVLGDTQASVDRLQGSWDKLWNSAGKAIAAPAVPAMNAISNDLDYGTALREGLKKRGMGYWGSETWIATHLPFGFASQSDEADDIAKAAGYSDPEWLKSYGKRRYERGVNRPSVGRQSMPIGIASSPGPDRHRDGMQYSANVPVNAPVQPYTSWRSSMADLFRVPAREEWKNALKIDVPEMRRSTIGVGEHPSKDELPLKIDAGDLKQSADDAGKTVSDAGKQAGESIKDSAAFFRVAGVDVGAAISQAADKLMTAAKSFNVNAAKAPSNGVNADTGKTNSFATAPPGGNGGGGGGF